MGRESNSEKRYGAFKDPYLYEGSEVLKNKPNLRTQEELDHFESFHVALRAREGLPGGRLSVRHYQAIHRHLFQDVYTWAGKFRTVRMAKQGSMFCYPEHIQREMKTLFASLKKKRFLRGLSKEKFIAEASEFLAALNAIHPFREGNGRTQLMFLALLSDKAGHPLNFEELEPEDFLDAMIESFHGNLKPLTEELSRLLGH